MHRSWHAQQRAEAIMRVYEAPSDTVSARNAERYETQAADFWDKFYQQNQRAFFKDRHYLHREFPCLSAPDARVLEVRSWQQLA